MGLYDTFETDAELEKKGVILDYGDFRVRIAFAGGSNKKHVAYSEKKFKPLRHAINSGAIDNDRASLVLYDIYAETIILDWETKVGKIEGTDEDNWVVGIEPKGGGDLLPVTKPNIIQTFKNLPALFNDIKVQAESISNFRTKEMEDDSGNSLSS